MKDGTLFLFTKKFPYGQQEKYISDELPYLCEQFGKVIIIPGELFGETGEQYYTIPSNASVWRINETVATELPKLKKSYGEFFKIWFHEFFNHPRRKYFFRFTRRYASILRYQQASADVFGNYLKVQQIDPAKSRFYTYWLHNSTLMLAILKSRGGIDNFVTRAHSIDLYNEWWGGISEKMTPLPFMMFKLKWITKVSAISEHGKKHLIDHYPRYRSKFCRHYLGVDDQGVNPQRAEKDFTVVTCSGFSPNKRIDRMPAILSNLEINVRWFHFGGSETDVNEMKRKISTLPSNISVELLGQKKPEEISGFYQSRHIDLFVNLSRQEGLPVSIMEAFSFGIPAMATAVYGTPEIVDEQTGHLLPLEFTNEEAAKYIETLYASATKEQLAGSNARKKFLDTFNAPVNYSRFVQDVLIN